MSTPVNLLQRRNSIAKQIQDNPAEYRNLYNQWQTADMELRKGLARYMHSLLPTYLKNGTIPQNIEPNLRNWIQSYNEYKIKHVNLTSQLAGLVNRLQSLAVAATGRTARNSNTIAQLQAKINALGSRINEFDSKITQQVRNVQTAESNKRRAQSAIEELSQQIKELSGKVTKARANTNIVLQREALQKQLTEAQEALGRAQTEQMKVLAEAEKKMEAVQTLARRQVLVAMLSLDAVKQQALKKQQQQITAAQKSLNAAHAAANSAKNATHEAAIRYRNNALGETRILLDKSETALAASIESVRRGANIISELEITLEQFKKEAEIAATAAAAAAAAEKAEAIAADVRAVEAARVAKAAQAQAQAAKETAEEAARKLNEKLLSTRATLAAKEKAKREAETAKEIAEAAARSAANAAAEAQAAAAAERTAKENALAAEAEARREATSAENARVAAAEAAEASNAARRNAVAEAAHARTALAAIRAAHARETVAAAHATAHNAKALAAALAAARQHTNKTIAAAAAAPTTQGFVTVVAQPPANVSEAQAKNEAATESRAAALAKQVAAPAQKYNNKNWSKFVIDVDTYIKSTRGLNKQGNPEKFGYNNIINPLAQKLKNSKQLINNANTPNKKAAARNKYIEAKQAWDNHKDLIHKIRAFYNYYWDDIMITRGYTPHMGGKRQTAQKYAKLIVENKNFKEFNKNSKINANIKNKLRKINEFTAHAQLMNSSTMKTRIAKSKNPALARLAFEAANAVWNPPGMPASIKPKLRELKFNNLSAKMNNLRTQLTPSTNIINKSANGRNVANKKTIIRGRLIKNENGKAYFVNNTNKTGTRYPVLGTPVRGGGFIFNKSGQKQPALFNKVVRGEVQVR